MNGEFSNHQTDRQQALAQIQQLMDRFEFTLQDISRARGKEHSSLPETRSGDTVARILAYFGGIFLLSGMTVLVSLQWSEMNSYERVVVTLGTGIVVFILAQVAGRTPRFQAARMPLNLIAALLQPTGILVALYEFSPGGDWHFAALLAASLMLTQQVMTFLRTRSTELLFATVLFACWFLSVFLDLFIGEEHNAILTGGFLVMLCATLERSRYSVICPVYYFFGSVSYLAGTFSLVEGSPFELGFLLLTTAGMLLSTRLRSRTLLFTHVVAAFAFIGYFTNRYFLDSIGWPLALIALGLVFVALAALAVRLDRKYLVSTSVS